MYKKELFKVKEKDLITSAHYSIRSSLVKKVKQILDTIRFLSKEETELY